MTPKRIKVLFVITSLNWGGTELRLIDIVQNLDLTQFEPVIFAAKGGVLLSKLDSRLTRVGVPDGSIVQSLLKLWQIIRDERPDVVWCLLDSITSFAGRLFARLSNVPVIILSTHGRGRSTKGLKFPNLILTKLLRTPVITVSDSIRDLLIERGVPADLITTQINGVDTDRFSPSTESAHLKQRLLGIDPDTLVIGSVGNLKAVKGQKLLIEAAAKVVREVPNSLFVMVGEGEDRAELEQLIEQHNLKNHIRLLGHREDVSDLLRAFDIFAFTSIYEGCPNAVLEAMASGLPIVTTDFGGAAKLIGTESGIVIPTRDAEKFADALIQLMINETQRQGMGSKAHEHAVQNLSNQAMIAARERFILKLYADASSNA